MTTIAHGTSVLSYTASLIKQGRYRFYTLSMPSDVLGRTCFAIPRDEDPEEGFQRLLNTQRAQEIADFIDAGMATIPTSVVLSAQEIAGFRYDARKRTLSFLDNPKSFLILDGQHRVYGFKLAKTEMRVPVVIYNGLSRMEESRLFIDINTKQRPVPNELLLDIRKLAEYQNDVETRLGRVFDLFDTESTSPLLGKMSASKKRSGFISRVTFNSAMKPLLSLFGDADTSKIYQVVASYLSATLSEARKQKKDVPIANPTAFRALMMAFPDVTQRVSDRYGKSYDADKFSLIVGEMLSRIKASTLKSPGTNASNYSKLLTDALKSKSILD